jgi:hypothetical protein
LNRQQTRAKLSKSHGLEPYAAQKRRFYTGITQSTSSQPARDRCCCLAATRQHMRNRTRSNAVTFEQAPHSLPRTSQLGTEAVSGRHQRTARWWKTIARGAPCPEQVIRSHGEPVSHTRDCRPEPFQPEPVSPRRKPIAWQSPCNEHTVASRASQHQMNSDPWQAPQEGNAWLLPAFADCLVQGKVREVILVLAISGCFFAFFCHFFF